MIYDVNSRFFTDCLFVCACLPAFIGVPCELVEHFEPRHPIILGGVTLEEQRMGYVRVRLKKHRWHQRILKSFDPLILSLGWRRFQSMPVFATEDHNKRQRMLKYTPEHLHCLAMFYGEVCVCASVMVVVIVFLSSQSHRFCVWGNCWFVIDVGGFSKKMFGRETGCPRPQTHLPSIMLMY